MTQYNEQEIREVSERIYKKLKEKSAIGNTSIWVIHEVLDTFFNLESPVRDEEGKDAIEIPIELFKNIFHFFSAMNVCPEIFESVSKERFIEYFSEMQTIYNTI